MTLFKMADEHDTRADDVEATIQRAKRWARKRGGTVDVVDVPAGVHIATIWPDGKVDVTWHGNRYA